jgi:hypothetical protein
VTPCEANIPILIVCPVLIGLLGIFINDHSEALVLNGSTQYFSGSRYIFDVIAVPCYMNSSIRSPFLSLNTAVINFLAENVYLNFFASFGECGCIHCYDSTLVSKFLNEIQLFFTCTVLIEKLNQSKRSQSQSNSLHFGAPWPFSKTNWPSLHSRDPSRWPSGTLHPQNLAITSPTSRGRSVSIFRSRAHATQISFSCPHWDNLIEIRGS